MNDTATPEQQLEELLQFVYLMPVAIIKLNEHGNIDMLNPVAVQLLAEIGIDSGTISGRKLMDGLIPGLWERWNTTSGEQGLTSAPERITVYALGGKTHHLVLRLVRSDTACTMISLEDVTQTINQERELARQRQQIGVLIEHIHGYCVALLDTGGRISEWNPSIERMLGRDQEATVGVPFLTLIDPKIVLHNDFSELADRVREQGWCNIDAPMQHRDGSQLWIESIITPLVEENGLTSAYVAVIRDVTQQHQTSEMLISQALTDPLTELHNRRGLEHRLPGMLSNQRNQKLSASWIAVDIDHFKTVNDTFGHDAGDDVLKAVASILRQAVRDDDLAVRMGGEEFLVFLPKATTEGAQIVAERMRQRIEGSTVIHDGHAIRVTASFGIAPQTIDQVWTEAVTMADASLYLAKTQGRNRIVVAQSSESSN